MAKRRTNERIVQDGGQESAALQEPAHEDIRERAYYRYVDRGRVHGFDLEDWYVAEAELRARPAVGERGTSRRTIGGALTARTNLGRRRVRAQRLETQPQEKRPG
jgi:hypothetical protein